MISDKKIIRVLAISSLYPCSSDPHKGVFVENRLRALQNTNRCTYTVISPVPWFPLKHRLFGRFATFAKIPSSDIRHNISIWYNRYLSFPMIHPHLRLPLFYRAIDNFLKHQSPDEFDIIDAHYLYPDGVAASILAERIGKPLFLTARGSDVMLHPRNPTVHKQIQAALDRSCGVITVCDFLKEKILSKFNIKADKVHTIRNGVNTDHFYPKVSAEAKVSCRREFNLPVHKKIIVSAGWLIPRKRHDLVIRAMVYIPKNVHLIIVGNGPEYSSLKSLISSLSLCNRVTLHNAVPPHMMCNLYNAADILVLASDSEGIANVLLEAMACGTPVVATNAGGNAEILENSSVSTVVTRWTPDAIAHAINKRLLNPSDTNNVRRYAEQFSWSNSTSEIINLFIKTP